MQCKKCVDVSKAITNTLVTSFGFIDFVNLSSNTGENLNNKKKLNHFQSRPATVKYHFWHISEHLFAISSIISDLYKVADVTKN